MRSRLLLSDAPASKGARRQLIGRLLMTVSLVGVGAGPLFLELGATHLFNPSWPPHARFHLIWFVSGNAALGALATLALWRGWPDARRGAHGAFAMNGAMLLGFFTAALSSPAYEGALVETGAPPPILGLEPNVWIFITLAICVLVGWRLCTRPSTPAN